MPDLKAKRQSDLEDMLSSDLAQNLPEALQARYRQQLAALQGPDPELMAAAEKRRDQSQQQINSGFVSPEELQGLTDAKRTRALLSGLNSAANKFGSHDGDGGPKSTLSDTMSQFDQADAERLAGKKEMTREGQLGLSQATNEIAALKEQPVKQLGELSKGLQETQGLVQAQQKVSPETVATLKQGFARMGVKAPLGLENATLYHLRSDPMLQKALSVGSKIAKVARVPNPGAAGANSIKTYVDPEDDSPDDNGGQLVKTSISNTVPQSSSEGQEPVASRSGYQSALAGLAKQRAQKVQELKTNPYANPAALKIDIQGLDRQAGEYHQKLKKIDEGAKWISERFDKSGAPQLAAELQRVEALTGSLDVLAAKVRAGQSVDLPGYGRFESVLPDAVETQPAKNLRQAVQKLMNVEIKNQAGTAVSANEMERFKKAMGSGWFATPDQLVQGLADLKEALRSDIENVKGGVGEEAWNEYQQRTKGRFLPFDPDAAQSQSQSQSAGPARGGPGAKAGKDWRDLSGQKQGSGT